MKNLSQGIDLEIITCNYDCSYTKNVAILTGVKLYSKGSSPTFLPPRFMIKRTTLVTENQFNWRKDHFDNLAY